MTRIQAIMAVAVFRRGARMQSGPAHFVPGESPTVTPRYTAEGTPSAPIVITEDLPDGWRWQYSREFPVAGKDSWTLLGAESEVMGFIIHDGGDCGVLIGQNVPDQSCRSRKRDRTTMPSKFWWSTSKMRRNRPADIQVDTDCNHAGRSLQGKGPRTPRGEDRGCALGRWQPLGGWGFSRAAQPPPGRRSAHQPQHDLYTGRSPGVGRFPARFGQSEYLAFAIQRSVHCLRMGT